jgi:hypothetical protein
MPRGKSINWMASLDLGPIVNLGGRQSHPRAYFVLRYANQSLAKGDRRQAGWHLEVGQQQSLQSSRLRIWAVRTLAGCRIAI